jgi:phage shock protein A
MRNFLYWFVGDRAGRVIIASWNWLWGQPVQQGGKLSVEVAQASLQEMQQSVYFLTEGVAKAVAAYEKAKKQYQQKQGEAYQAEHQAQLAMERNQPEAARLVMARLIALERVLPRFSTQVQQAEQAVNKLKERLNQERQKLESLEVEMQNMKALAEVNEALAIIANVHSELRIDSALNQFQEAQSAIENRHIQTQAFQELSEKPTEKLQADLEKMTLEEEINQRLNRLNMGQSNSLPL